MWRWNSILDIDRIFYYYFSNCEEENFTLCTNYFCLTFILMSTGRGAADSVKEI